MSFNEFAFCVSAILAFIFLLVCLFLSVVFLYSCIRTKEWKWVLVAIVAVAITIGMLCCELLYLKNIKYGREPVKVSKVI